MKTNVTTFLHLVFGLMIGFTVFYTSHAQAQRIIDDREFKLGRELDPRDIGNDNSISSPDIQMGTPVLSGTGCPEGSASATLTSDQKTLSLIFDKFTSEAGGGTGLPRAFKQCQVRIPLTVPAGLQVSVVRIDHRGFNLAPAQGATAYTVVYGFHDLVTGQPISDKIRRRKTFEGPLNENYTLASLVREVPLVSSCGRSVQLVVDTNAGAMSNSTGEPAMATVDSIDAAQGNLENTQKFHLLWTRCQGGNGGGRIIRPPPPPSPMPSPRPPRCGIRCGR